MEVIKLHDVIVDFNEAINDSESLLQCCQTQLCVDYDPVIRHTLDLLLYGELYEAYTGDLYYDILIDYRIPTDIALDLAKQFREFMRRQLSPFISFDNETQQAEAVWISNTSVNVVVYQLPITTTEVTDDNKNIYEQ